MLSRNRGFTLLELLVVVAIIGLLATVVIVALGSARAKGRDARRMHDIQEIRTAIELYIADHGGAPDGFADDAEADIDSWNSLGTLLAPYINKLPRDPYPCSEYPCTTDTPGTQGSWFAYVYKGPSILRDMESNGIQFNTPINSSTYTIMAENLEKGQKSFVLGADFLLGSYYGE